MLLCACYFGIDVGGEDVDNPFRRCGVLCVNVSDPVVSAHLTLQETVQLSLLFFGIWFAQNLLFNLSLEYTTLSSNTILSSTSGLFVIMWTSCCLSQGCRFLDLAAVVVTIGGVVLISWKDFTLGSLMGDVLAVTAAAVFGIYSSVLKWKLGNDDNVDMVTWSAGNVVGVHALANG